MTEPCPVCRLTPTKGDTCPIPGCPPNINPDVIRTWPKGREGEIPVMATISKMADFRCNCGKRFDSEGKQIAHTRETGHGWG